MRDKRREWRKLQNEYFIRLILTGIMNLEGLTSRKHEMRTELCNTSWDEAQMAE